MAGIRTKGNAWIGEKRDVTSEFIQVTLQKFEPGTIQNISIDGKDKFQVLVTEIGKKITVDGKEI